MLRHAFRASAAVLPAQRRAAASLFQRSFASYPPHEVVGLPALSPTMESGNLAKWRMKEGDQITAGDIICEIETDKAVVEFESTDDMYLAKILVPEGTEGVGVGQPIFVACEDESSIAALADFKLDESAAAPAAPVLSPEEKPPKKEEVAVMDGAPVVPADFLVTSQTTRKNTEGPAIPAAAAAKPAAPAPAAAAPKPAPAAPATAAPSTTEKWGLGLKKSPLSLSLLKKQQAYIDLYGLTGTTPLAIATEKK